MTFQKRQKSIGRLFSNKKTKELSPQMVGAIKILANDMEAFIEQYNASGTVQANIALWFYPGDDENQSYASVQLSPPFVPKPRPRVAHEEEASPEEFFRQVARETRPSQEPSDTE